MACLVSMSLFSCTSREKEKNNDRTNKDIQKTDSSSLSETGYLKLNGDSVIIPSFEIEVSLSKKANEKLKTDKETIIVAAYFSGLPKDTTSKEYLKTGEFNITSSERELTDGRIAKFEGIKFSRALYDSLADKNIELLINIYSGRRSTKDNLLDCDIFYDKMSNIKGKKITVKGKLIGE